MTKLANKNTDCWHHYEIGNHPSTRQGGVTPTFYKNKFFVHIGVHIKCITNYSTYEKLSKNKSCIGCIALHGMAYYIFLNSFRSLEEFRKNPHVKIPPKSPSTNFQSLGKFKNLIFNSKTLFFAFGPADPVARSAFGPASPQTTPSPQAETVPAGPSSPRVGRFFVGNTFSLSDHAFPSRPPLPRLSVNRAPPVRSTPFPTLADPGRKFPRAAAPPRRCPTRRMPPSFYSPPSSLSPLNPLQTEP
jgi:hypothetical protein